MSDRHPRGQMPLLEHVRELRGRLLKAALAVGLGTVVGFAVFPLLLDVLMQPYCAHVAAVRPDGACRLVALRPLEPFSVRVKTGFAVGLFLAAPVLVYQFWRFVTPGLTPRERRWTLPFVLMSQAMFAAGVAFAYLMIPRGLRILLAMGGPLIEDLLSADAYLSFFLRMSLAFGLVFELPLVLIVLSLAGIIRRAGLVRARPYAIVTMFIAAAFITPTTDAFTLLALAIPMVLFYELAIAAAWLIERRRKRAQP